MLLGCRAFLPVEGRGTYMPCHSLILILAVLGAAPLNQAQRLRKAVETGSVDRVKALLESGVDANTEYENGDTPICFADNPKIAANLLDNSVPLRFHDRKGGTPATLAEEIKSPKAICRLLQK
jgi:hypothetical protein